MIENAFPNLTVGNYKLGDRGFYIGRAMPQYGLSGSPLANQWKAKDSNKSSAITKYREWLHQQIKVKNKAFKVLLEIKALVQANKQVKLICWCKDKDGNNECHGDVIVSAINWMIKNNIS